VEYGMIVQGVGNGVERCLLTCFKVGRSVSLLILLRME
jgi:hypothetical protein